MDDLYSSNIDDELFGDEPGGSNTGNPGQQDGNDGVKGNQGDNNNGNGGNEPPKTGGRGNDSEILDWFNSNQVKGVVDEDGGNSDVLSEYLRMKGIDPDNIQINDEQDNPSYSSFKDLGRQEQLDLLRSLDSTDEGNDYAKEVLPALKKAGIRAEIDLRNEKISYKIREHSLKKVPVMLVIGKKETADQTVTIRRLGQEKQETLALSDVIAKLKAEAVWPHIDE